MVDTLGSAADSTKNIFRGYNLIQIKKYARENMSGRICLGNMSGKLELNLTECVVESLAESVTESVSESVAKESAVERKSAVECLKVHGGLWLTFAVD